MAVSFKEAVCARLGWEPEDYEERLFWKTLYWHARIPAWFLWNRRHVFFKEDFEMIREVAQVSDVNILRMELNRFYGRNKRKGNWVRSAFALRVSAKKLLKYKHLLVA